jgi:hypothetical protein
VVTLHAFLLGFLEDHLRGCRDYVQDLVHPLECHPFSGVSQLTENTPFLIGYLTDNLPTLDRAVLHWGKKRELDVIVSGSLFAFFPFFSISDELDVAQQFDKSVTDLMKSDLIMRLLIPFFTSPSTFCLLEHTLDHFFRTFILDCTCPPEDERDSLLDRQGSFLIQCFIDAVLSSRGSTSPCSAHMPALAVAERVFGEPFRKD